METERIKTYHAYWKSVDSAHEAFRGKNFTELAELFFEQGEIATRMYKIEGTDTWDIRSYLAYNAAGWEFEELGDCTVALLCYRLALTSCERLASNRGSDWQKNINHLEFLIKRVEKRV